jgi:hypothetical protein
MQVILLLLHPQWKAKVGKFVQALFYSSSPSLEIGKIGFKR